MRPSPARFLANDVIRDGKMLAGNEETNCWKYGTPDHPPLTNYRPPATIYPPPTFDFCVLPSAFPLPGTPFAISLPLPFGNRGRKYEAEPTVSENEARGTAVGAGERRGKCNPLCGNALRLV